MEELKIEDMDLYEILGLQITCSVQDIKKAYRKKALECHPDKNHDNPNAAKQFHQLTKILELLTDDAARKAYDKVLRAKQESTLRHKALDNKRRKLKEDLEAKEKQATKASAKSDDQILKEEIERLRKEGSRQVQEEMEYMAKKLGEEFQKKQNCLNPNRCKIKIQWKALKDDGHNGGYNREVLARFLSKYGDISALIMSKKKGSALVEFTTQHAAEMAVDFEKGLSENPLQLQWINETKAESSAKSFTIKPSDFESIVLTRMKQAEERKKLIEQMMAEDNEV